jgi:hypothetical protein
MYSSGHERESLMCQINNRRVKHETVMGYRVYTVYGEDSRKLVSYYGKQPMPKMGRETPCELKTKPFHMFCSFEDVRQWNFHTNFGRDKVVVLCELSKSLYKGQWDCDHLVNTYTGKVLKVLRPVFQIINDKPIFYEGEENSYGRNTKEKNSR